MFSATPDSSLSEETDRILEAGARYGLRPKIHANELAVSGGVQVGGPTGSVCRPPRTHRRRGNRNSGRRSDRSHYAPRASLFLGMPYGPARKTIDSGAIAASPQTTIRLIAIPSKHAHGYVARMHQNEKIPAEAINATTINGAYAMNESRELRLGGIFLIKK